MRKDVIKTLLEEMIRRSQFVLRKNEIKVTVDFMDGYLINACVGQSIEHEKTYEIHIYNGVIDTLQMSLEEKYFKNFREKDIIAYAFQQSDEYFKLFEEDSLKKRVMNIIGLIIIHNIIFHECGHIVCGHCNKKKYKMSEMVSKNNCNSRYGHQAREMVADWYGVNQSFRALVNSLRSDYQYIISNKEDMSTLKKLFVMFCIALYCQFDLFEVMEGKAEKELDEYVLENRSHPHPYTRLSYCLEAMRESMMDILIEINKISEEEAWMIGNEIAEEAMREVYWFIKNMGDSRFFEMLKTPSIHEAYYRCRKKAWGKRKYKNALIDIKIAKMPSDYMKIMRSKK